jgi:hypothetical protein
MNNAKFQSEEVRFLHEGANAIKNTTKIDSLVKVCATKCPVLHNFQLVPGK